MLKHILILLALSLICVFSAESIAAEKLILGGGAEGGVYLPLARELTDIINRSIPQNTFKPQESAGSVENIEKLQNGVFILALAQSDTQYMAVNGYAEWTGNPAQGLRYICSLHPEAVTLVAAKDSGIKSVTDLRGKRVSLGVENSGQNFNARQILKSSGLDCANCIKTFELEPQDAVKKLQSGEIDAFFYTVGHPNDLISQAISGGNAGYIVPISGDRINTLLENVEYFSPALINIKTNYPQATTDGQPIKTVGVTAVLLTTDKLSDELAYNITKSIFDNIQALQEAIPALKGVNKTEMTENGRIAAYHPGALKYYKEAGTLKQNK